MVEFIKIVNMKTYKKSIIFLFLSVSFLGYSQDGKINANKDSIFIYVKQMPEYPGGMIALKRYVAMNVNYPKAARENNIQGTVFLRFEVTKIGEIGKIEILKSAAPFLDNEAIRVIRSLSGFKPGLQNEKPVNVWFSMPITFKLSSPQKNKFPAYKSKAGESFNEYLTNAISEIDKSRDPDVFGSVKLKIEITKKGKVGEIKKMEGINKAFDNELIKIVKALPDFEPGTKNGRAVSSYIIIPFVFNKRIYDLNNEEPEFLNSNISFENYIKEHLIYPKEALYAGMEGEAITRFVLSDDGKIKDIEVLNSSNPIFNKEAIKVMKSLPDMKVQKIHGKPANVRYKVQIKFDNDSLKIEKPKCKEDSNLISKRFTNAIEKNIEKKDIPHNLFLFLKIDTTGHISGHKIVYENEKQRTLKIDNLINKIVPDLPGFIPGKVNGETADTRYVVPIYGETVYIYVKKMPEFPGGVKAFYTYIREHVEYPDIAKKEGIEGVVFLRFEVTKKGSIGKIDIQKGVHPLLDNAAIKVIKSLPKFIPGEQNGKKVNVWYATSVTFKLN